MLRHLFPLLVLAALLPSCGRGGAEKVFPSPDKSLELHTRTNLDNKGTPMYMCVIAEITDAKTGNIVYRETTPASDNSKWSAAWIDNQTVRIDSKDVGLFTIHREPDGRWQGKLGS